MTPNPLVTVIITVFNGEKHLPEALDSVCAQTLEAWECIVVDDGSTDGTSDILQRYAAADQRFKVISSGRVGRAPALNLAWRAGSGVYVANLDADDIAHPERFAAQVAFLNQNPSVGILGTQCEVIRGDQLIEDQIRHPLTDEEIRRQFVRNNPIVHSSVMMRRKMLETIGGYNEKFTVLIDFELWVRSACIYAIANLPEALTVKRFHDQRFFRNKISLFVRISANIRVRWFAWRHFSSQFSDLRYVILEPIIKGTRSELRLLRGR